MPSQTSSKPIPYPRMGGVGLLCEGQIFQFLPVQFDHESCAKGDELERIVWIRGYEGSSIDGGISTNSSFQNDVSKIHRSSPSTRYLLNAFEAFNASTCAVVDSQHEETQILGIDVKVNCGSRKYGPPTSSHQNPAVFILQYIGWPQSYAVIPGALYKKIHSRSSNFMGISRFSMPIPPEIWPFMCDETQVNQVLLQCLGIASGRSTEVEFPSQMILRNWKPAPMSHLEATQSLSGSTETTAPGMQRIRSIFELCFNGKLPCDFNFSPYAPFIYDFALNNVRHEHKFRTGNDRTGLGIKQKGLYTRHSMNDVLYIEFNDSPNDFYVQFRDPDKDQEFYSSETAIPFDNFDCFTKDQKGYTKYISWLNKGVCRSDEKVLLRTIDRLEKEPKVSNLSNSVGPVWKDQWVLRFNSFCCQHKFGFMWHLPPDHPRGNFFFQAVPWQSKSQEDYSLRYTPPFTPWEYGDGCSVAIFLVSTSHSQNQLGRIQEWKARNEKPFILITTSQQVPAFEKAEWTRPNQLKYFFTAGYFLPSEVLETLTMLESKKPKALSSRNEAYGEKYFNDPQDIRSLLKPHLNIPSEQFRLSPTQIYKNLELVAKSRHINLRDGNPFLLEHEYRLPTAKLWSEHSLYLEYQPQSPDEFRKYTNLALRPEMLEEDLCFTNTLPGFPGVYETRWYGVCMAFRRLPSILTRSVQEKIENIAMICMRIDHELSPCFGCFAPEDFHQQSISLIPRHQRFSLMSKVALPGRDETDLLAAVITRVRGFTSEIEKAGKENAGPHIWALVSPVHDFAQSLLRQERQMHRRDVEDAWKKVQLKPEFPREN